MRVEVAARRRTRGAERVAIGGRRRHAGAEAPKMRGGKVR